MCKIIVIDKFYFPPIGFQSLCKIINKIYFGNLLELSLNYVSGENLHRYNIYYNFSISWKSYDEERVRVGTNRGNEKEKWIPLEFPNLLFRRS